MNTELKNLVNDKISLMKTDKFKVTIIYTNRELPTTYITGDKDAAIRFKSYYKRGVRLNDGSVVRESKFEKIFC